MVKWERAGSAKELEIRNSSSVLCSHRLSNMAVKCDQREIPTSDGGPTRDLNPSDIFSGQFPEGLSVLVLDEDQAYLQVLEKDLQGFRYQVSVCNEEEQAMDLLRNHRNRFDIAIIEAQNSKGDHRFGLISKIVLEMDLPIIIISKDDSVKSVVNGMMSGACDYLIKPIRTEDLRMIFKHVASKMQGRRSVAAGKAEEKAPEKSSSVGDSATRNPNKRKRSNEEDNDHDGDRDRVSTSKKRRVVWDDDLHKQFLAAVEQLGAENAVPKKILELMNNPAISRENVASHLQKFRMNLKKQQEEKGKEKNKSLTTQQQGTMCSGENGNDYYKRGEVQIPTYHINNIPQPCVQQQHIMNTNVTTQLVSPLGHHYLGDGISVAVSGRNQVMSHHHQQVSESSCNEGTEDIYGHHNFGMHYIDDEVGNLTNLFVQSSHEVSCLQHHEPLMATTSMTPNHHHSSDFLEVDVHAIEPPMMHLRSFPSYPHHSFLDQQNIVTMADESGVLSYDSAYFVDNKNNNNKFT